MRRCFVKSTVSNPAENLQCDWTGKDGEHQQFKIYPLLCLIFVCTHTNIYVLHCSSWEHEENEWISDSKSMSSTTLFFVHWGGCIEKCRHSKERDIFREVVDKHSKNSQHFQLGITTRQSKAYSSAASSSRLNQRQSFS